MSASSETGSDPSVTASVLLVEDSVDTREALEALLVDSGYAVTTATDGDDALAVLRQGELPAVILLDLMMPAKDGWQFRYEQLQDPTLARVPVVILSGAGALPQKAEQLGVQDFLAKPVDITRLLATVRRYCCSRQ